MLHLKTATRSPEVGAFQCAADLYRALLARAAHAPDDFRAATLPEWVQCESGETGEFYAIPRTWDAALRRMVMRPDMAQAFTRPHGPVRPAGVSVRACFAFVSDGAQSSFTLIATRPRLMAYAEHVRKHWALYGGGLKLAEHAKPKASRKREEFKPGVLRAWADMLSEGHYADAFDCGETLGALYYVGGAHAHLTIAGPMQVDGLPNGIVSGFRAHDRRYVVFHVASGCKIGPDGATRRAAEENARAFLADVNGAGVRRADMLTESMARAAAVDQGEMRAAWRKAQGLDMPEAMPLAA